VAVRESLLAFSGLTALATGERFPAPVVGQGPRIWATASTDALITSPKEAINVFDFEPVMHTNVPPAHFGYIASGIDDEATLRANREGFLKFQLRPRRLVDVSTVDMSTDPRGEVRHAHHRGADWRPTRVPH
jgi:4-hydroxymandelate oxidase